MAVVKEFSIIANVRKGQLVVEADRSALNVLSKLESDSLDSDTTRIAVAILPAGMRCSKVSIAGEFSKAASISVGLANLKSSKGEFLAIPSAASIAAASASASFAANALGGAVLPVLDDKFPLDCDRVVYLRGAAALGIAAGKSVLVTVEIDRQV